MFLQVEPLGRNPEMESLGYLGEQAYWIRCRSCANGERPAGYSAAIAAIAAAAATAAATTGVEGGVGSNNLENGVAGGTGAGGERGKAAVGLGGGETAQLDAAQLDAAQLDAAQPEESAEGSDSSESDSEPERERKPEPMPFGEALTLLREHPGAKAAFLEPRWSFFFLLWLEWSLFCVCFLFLFCF